MKLQINVTKEILEKSKECGVNDCFVSENCAITLALQDVFPKAYTAYGEAHLQEGICVALPQEATTFIYAFDKATPSQRVQMQPISFQVEVPDEVVNRINIDEVKELLVNHPTLQLL